MSHDPVKKAEVLTLLGVDPAYLNIPRFYAKIQDVVDYFSALPNMRYSLLKVIGGKPGDKLDLAWSHVALQKEREALVQSLPVDEFETDIAAEIAKGYVPKPQIDRIRADIAKRKAKEAEEAELYDYEKRQALYQLDLDKIEKTVNEIELINERLLNG